MDNEKYAMRCFLLRLGFIGDEYAAARKLLLSRLSGDSSFKNGKRCDAAQAANVADSGADSTDGLAPDPSIVKALNKDGILPPKLYHYTNAGKDSSQIRTKHWMVTTIQAMVRNEIYIGHAVQLKNKMVSYRDKREVLRPVEERVRVENAFPAIIDPDTWDVVQEVNHRAAQRVKSSREPQQSLFGGFLVCADCHRTLQSHATPGKRSNGDPIRYINYLCQSYQHTYGASCSPHSIGEKRLKNLLLADIHAFAESICMDENAVLQLLKSRLIGGSKNSKADIDRERHSIRQRLHRLNVTMEKLYEDRVTGVLPELEFSEQARKIEEERLEMEQRLALLEQSEQEAAAKLSDIHTWMRLIRECTGTTIVDRDLLSSLDTQI